MIRLRIMLVVFISVLCLILGGCSFSSFSKSSSDSSHKSMPNKSIETVLNSYQYEVTTLTMLYIKSGGGTGSFQNDLSNVSKKYGIEDWENDIQTYDSIGIGLSQGGISDQSIKTLPFLQSENFIDHYSEILSGYYSSGKGTSS